MTVREYIKKNKVKDTDWIALYNKKHRWIICRQYSELEDYLDYEVIDAVKKGKFIHDLIIEYEYEYQLTRIRQDEENKLDKEEKQEKIKRKRK